MSLNVRTLPFKDRKGHEKGNADWLHSLSHDLFPEMYPEI